MNLVGNKELKAFKKANRVIKQQMLIILCTFVSNSAYEQRGHYWEIINIDILIIYQVHIG